MFRVCPSAGPGYSFGLGTAARPANRLRYRRVRECAQTHRTNLTLPDALLRVDGEADERPCRRLLSCKHRPGRDRLASREPVLQYRYLPHVRAGVEAERPVAEQHASADEDVKAVVGRAPCKGGAEGISALIARALVPGGGKAPMVEVAAQPRDHGSSAAVHWCPGDQGGNAFCATFAGSST